MTYLDRFYGANDHEQRPQPIGFLLESAAQAFNDALAEHWEILNRESEMTYENN